MATNETSPFQLQVLGDEGGPRRIDEFATFDGSVVAACSEEAQQAEQRVRSADRRHVFHSWSAQAKISPLPVAAAQGAFFFDYSGKGYLDLGSQLVSANLGHQHPELVDAIQRQATRVTNLNPAFAADGRSELAKRIVDSAQGEFSHVFFTNGGADAIEHAIRMARKTTSKAKILTAYRSYHGATGSAIMATGEARRHGNPTTDGDVKHFWGPFEYRSAFHSTSEAEETERALQHLENTLVFEGDVAAVLLEGQVGSSGVIPPTDGYLRGVRDICDRHGALWICDEVMSGFGRTGKLFAYEHGGATHNGKAFQPDLVTFAKGVNGGMAPMGGVLMTKQVADTFAEDAYPGGLTYSGHPLAAAPGVVAMDVYEREGIFERVHRLGEEVVRPRLERMAKRHSTIGHVRGRGLFFAIEFVSDRVSKAPAPADAMNTFATALKQAGIWPMVSANRLHFAPPLIISDADLEWALDEVEKACTLFDQSLSDYVL